MAREVLPLKNKKTDSPQKGEIWWYLASIIIIVLLVVVPRTIIIMITEKKWNELDARTMDLWVVCSMHAHTWLSYFLRDAIFFFLKTRWKQKRKQNRKKHIKKRKDANMLSLTRWECIIIILCSRGSSRYISRVHKKHARLYNARNRWVL